MSTYYADHSLELRRAFAEELPADELRSLHERRPLRHFLIAAALFAVLAASLYGAAVFDRALWWIPLAVIGGFAIFNCTVLLHEVVHQTVTRKTQSKLQRALGVVYALPSGISSTQFTRWHLDHHAGLGSSEDDPKRHHLSPKRNARWLKILYFTPALFVIYFRAARREAESYPEEIRRKIGRERNVTIALHLVLLALVATTAGWGVAWRAYLFPYFFVFPIAFGLNRLGQHYDIDPEQPANWSTLIRGSRFWDVVYLCSNYHLEHHYFPRVPFYNLPQLQKLLLPFYERRGIAPRTYGRLFWHYIVLNRKPHTKWGEGGRRGDEAGPVVSF